MRGCVPLGQSGLGDVLDSAVGLFKEKVDQFAALELWQHASEKLRRVTAMTLCGGRQSFQIEGTQSSLSDILL